MRYITEIFSIIWSATINDRTIKYFNGILVLVHVSIIYSSLSDNAPTTCNNSSLNSYYITI